MTHRLPALTATPKPNKESLLLMNARLFDGINEEVREGVTILIENGVIRRIGDVTESLPANTKRLDLQQRTVMPGLIDAHTHTAGHDPEVLEGAEAALPNTAVHFLHAELREYLRQGVTTIRIAGSQGIRPQEARQAIRYGAFRGPRILTCGRIVSATAPGGRFYGDMYREADGPDDMRKAVREQFRDGADYIKIMTTGARSNELEDPDPLQLTKEEFRAVADEVHRMGFKLAAHCEGLDGCEEAISQGVDTIEHGMYLHQRPELLKAMAAKGIFLVPTLSGYYWMAGINDAIDPADGERNPWMPANLTELADYNIQEGSKSLRAAKEAGVKIVLGSDAAASTALEIQRMIFHGMTSFESLQAGTRNAAEALGLNDQIGTVEEGKLADLLILDGSPLAEPELLCDSRKIWLVLQLGAPVAGQALERDLEPK